MKQENRFYFSPVFIYTALVIFAPLGIYLLWKSQKFSKEKRLALCSFSCAFFIFIIAITSIMYSSNNISDLFLDTNEDTASVVSINDKSYSTDDLSPLNKEDLNNLYTEAIKMATQENISIKENSLDFLHENASLFPATTKTNVKKIYSKLVDSPDYNYLLKNLDKYSDKIISISGTLSKVTEKKIDGNIISLLEVPANDSNKYIIVFPGPIGIQEEQNLTCLGVPVRNTNNNIVIISGKLESLY